MSHSEKDVSFTFSFEEHEVLLEILIHSMDTVNFVIASDSDIEKLAETETFKRAKAIRKIHDEVLDRWLERFDSEDD